MMTCSTCGRAGHNKRYHRVQESNKSTSGQPQLQPTEGVAGDSNPIDAIDTQVLKEHFQMVDSLKSYSQTEEATSEKQVSENPTSQVLTGAEDNVSTETLAYFKGQNYT